jgi:hypothetical protein
MEKRKWRSFTISDKIAIVANFDAYIETCADLASQLELPVSKTTFKNHETIERSSIKCGHFSKQWKSLTHLPLKKMESGLSEWFKQACAGNISIDGREIREKSFQITACLGADNFAVLIVGSIDLRGDITLFIKLLSG